jgi:hypothetical protein
MNDIFLKRLNNVAYLRYAGCCWGNYFPTELASLTGCGDSGVVSVGDMRYCNSNSVNVMNMENVKLYNYLCLTNFNPVRALNSVKKTNKPYFLINP